MPRLVVVCAAAATVLSLANLPRLCLAGYKVTDGVVEVCENPEVEDDTHFGHQHHHNKKSGGGDRNSSTVYRANRTPPPKRTTQLRVPRVHFFHPLEDSLLELNRVIYEKNLWGTNDGAFYYEQPAHEVQMTAHAEIAEILPSYKISDTSVTTLYSVSHVCENLGVGEEDSVECVIDEFDLNYSLWRSIDDGFTFSTSQHLKPVVLKIEHNNQTTDLVWRYNVEERSPPSRTEHRWHQPTLKITVPPQTTYRFVAEIQHETVSGTLKLKGRVVSDGLNEFRWKIKTCASNALDASSSNRRCQWIEQGFFNAKDIANTLTEADRLKICGSRHPRLCRLQVDGDTGHVYVIASAQFQVALPPKLKTFVVDTTNNTRIVDEAAAVDVVVE